MFGPCRLYDVLEEPGASKHCYLGRVGWTKHDLFNFVLSTSWGNAQILRVVQTRPLLVMCDNMDLGVCKRLVRLKTCRSKSLLESIISERPYSTCAPTVTEFPQTPGMSCDAHPL